MWEAISCEAPTDRLTQPVRERHADDGRDRKTEKHAPHGLGSLFNRDERSGDQRSDSEVSAMREAAQESK